MKAKISWIEQMKLVEEINGAKTIEELKVIMIKIVDAIPTYDPYN